MSTRLLLLAIAAPPMVAAAGNAAQCPAEEDPSTASFVQSALHLMKGHKKALQVKSAWGACSSPKCQACLRLLPGGDSERVEMRDGLLTNQVFIPDTYAPGAEGVKTRMRLDKGPGLFERFLERWMDNDAEYSQGGNSLDGYPKCEELYYRVNEEGDNFEQNSKIYTCQRDPSRKLLKFLKQSNPEIQKEGPSFERAVCRTCSCHFNNPSAMRFHTNPSKVKELYR